MLTITEGLAERFFSKIEQTSGCWNWLGALNRGGYGVIGLGGRREGTALAHRVAYGLYNGDPGERCVMHSCDNRRCVRPSHLSLGTYADNNRDMALKGRAKNQNTEKEVCRRGHLLDGSNVRLRTNGTRRCRLCATLIQRERRRMATC